MTDSMLGVMGTLKERVMALIDLVENLRSENNKLRARLSILESELVKIEKYKEESQNLESQLQAGDEELKALRTERDHIKNRIEEILQNLDRSGLV